MRIKHALTAMLVCAAVTGPALAQEPVDLTRYEELRANDVPTLEMMLTAMYDTVFYAQESIGGPTICATPIPLSGPRLVHMIDSEIVSPTHPDVSVYEADHRLGFILINALKADNACS